MALRTVVLLLASAAAAAPQPAPVTTYHNDAARTGQYLAETTLTPALLSAGNFGKLFSYAVDGYVYAQPLYVPGLAIPGKGVRNVLFVATENDSVYALDADANTVLWQRSFVNPAKGVTPVPSGDTGTGDLVPQIGITGTPVIDPVAQTLYVVTKVKVQPPATPSGYFQQLHALALTTGAERVPPALIETTAAGTCSPQVGGKVAFYALTQHNRAGLALSNGVVYVVFASHGDGDPYEGWVIGYHATTLAQVSQFVTTPNYAPAQGLFCRGGIWQGGAAPAIDAAGTLFLATGNAPFNPALGDFGDSVVRLLPGSPTLRLVDYFTPDDQALRNSFDNDLGSGGTLLLPDQPGASPHVLLTAGKEGTIYVLNRDNLGRYNPNTNNQILQSLPNAVGGVFGMPAYWNGFVYYNGQFDNVKAFAVSSGRLSVSPTSSTAAFFQFPGPGLSISASGTQNGILWAQAGDGYNANLPPVLHAYDATNLTAELYNSSTANGGQDNAPGFAVKFAVPTVANGKVYVGSSNAVTVYGKLR